MNVKRNAEDGLKMTINTEKTEIDEAEDMVEGIHSVKGLSDLEIIKNERVSERKITNGIIDEVKNKVVGILDKETKSDIKVIPSDVKTVNNDIEMKRDDLERAGLERLAEIERLAENERQAKIKRREELDRIARLQRVLALVRAPELDSIAKTKNVDNFKELVIITENNPRADQVEVSDKQLTKVEPVVGEAYVTNKTRIEGYEGIAKLERMSKQDRILEIDRLVKLELEAEAKRTAEIECSKTLERDTKLERIAKIKQVKEIDIKAELEKAEKKSLEEKERQEKIKRREELDRVSKLQRVLVMVQASESDRLAEIKQGELERSAEIKRREESKLLEELGILPKQQPPKNNAVEEIKHVEEVKPVVEIKTAVIMNQVHGINTVVKNDDVNPRKGSITEMQQVTKENATNGVDTTTVEQSKEEESESSKEIVSGIKRESEIKPAAGMQPNRNARKNVKEELDRVANLNRIIAMVRNTDAVTVAPIKQDIEVEKQANIKKEEAHFLKELGILPKETVTPEDSEVKSEKELNLEAQILPGKNISSVKQKGMSTDVKQMTETKKDAEIDAVTNVGQSAKNIDTRLEIEAKYEKEAKIKRATEMERRERREREAKQKRREELDRLADLQRVVALLPNEEFDHITDMKQAELEIIAEKNRKEDLKVLVELGIITKYDGAEKEIDDKVNKFDKSNDKYVKEELKGTDFESAESVSEHSIATERKTNKQIAENQINLAALRVAQMRRVAELGREMKVTIMEEEFVQKEKHITETELRKTNIKDINEKQSELKLPDKRKVKVDFVSGMIRKEDLEPIADITPPDGNHKVIKPVIVKKVKQEKPEVKLTIKSEKEMFLSPLVEVKRESEMQLMESKRLREMKRVVAERVRGYDCEWDGQMMYGRGRL